MTRKLASIQVVKDIQPIDGADAIDVATINGWKVVVKKGEFSVGQEVVYFEVDSFLPVAPQYEFLRKGCFRSTTWGGDGFRLRTIKLRGQISQGLILSLDQAFGEHWDITEPFCSLYQEGTSEVGTDVTEWLNVQKWDPPLPAQLAGKAAGLFPTDIVPKTDQERIQNCYDEIMQSAPDGECWEVTIKLDGSSCTIFKLDGKVRVCSRNLELKIDDIDNTFVQMALKVGDRIPEGFAIQGELMGPGIQGNREQLPAHKLFVYNVYSINAHEYFRPEPARTFVKLFMRDAQGKFDGVEYVPVITPRGQMGTLEDVLESANAAFSLNHPIAEGLVFKSLHREASFKAISNRYLLKEE